jgi:nucleoside 2-deoxyribosyltransferase
MDLMKVYIATGLERIETQKQVAGWLREAGHEITYDWGTHGPACGSGLERIVEVAHAELNGVMHADVVLALLPGGRGTHFEIGAAVGVGIPVVLWRESSDDGLFEDDRRTCAFYHLGDVHQLTAPLSKKLAINMVERLGYRENY